MSQRLSKFTYYCLISGSERVVLGVAVLFALPLCCELTVVYIDTSLQVTHVILFDFPHTMVDYLHRVGRTGRVGSANANCRASILMTHRQDVKTAWQIKACVLEPL